MNFIEVGCSFLYIVLSWNIYTLHMPPATYHIHTHPASGLAHSLRPSPSADAKYSIIAHMHINAKRTVIWLWRHLSSFVCLCGFGFLT